MWWRMCLRQKPWTCTICEASCLYYVFGEKQWSLMNNLDSDALSSQKRHDFSVISTFCLTEFTKFHPVWEMNLVNSQLPPASTVLHTHTHTHTRTHSHICKYVYIHHINIYLSFYLSLSIYICICIFWLHFFVNTNFIKHNRHFMSTYFLLDPFEFPYYFYRIRGEIGLCIVHSFMYP